MKSLILCAALFVASAQAETFATAPNVGGGLINLTSNKGKCTGESLVVYSTASTGEFTMGCWELIDDHVLVVYSNGLTRLYDLDGFTKKSTKPAKAAGTSL